MKFKNSKFKSQILFRWVDGKIDRWIGGKIDKWKDAKINKLIDEKMNGWKGGKIDRSIDRKWELGNGKWKLRNRKFAIPPALRDPAKHFYRIIRKRDNFRFRIPTWPLVSSFVIIFLLMFAFLFQCANPFDPSRHEIIIPQGASAYSVQKILEKNGILKPNSGFALIARTFGFSKHLHAGKYSLSPSDTFFGILLKLASGKVIPLKQIKVTFPEGSSIYKMGEILKKQKVSDPEVFQALVKEGINEEIREKHWNIFKYISSESLEGYLYPDTYMFFENAAVKDIAETMLGRFEKVVLPFWKRASNDTEYDLHEILTLASIIEKEAKIPLERLLVSSVYHNRLKAGMALAACPTIKYALDKPTKKVYKDQLSIDSPYNTYKIKGLPPGPICNPGIDSISAAIYPAVTDYYYFVAKPDGSHIFSKTWREHQRARQEVGEI